MAKPVQVQLQPRKQEPLRSTSKNCFLPEKVTVDDFFRLKRDGNGWVVEMVRVPIDAERHTVHAWDLLSNAERRLLTMAMDAERERR